MGSCAKLAQRALKTENPVMVQVKKFHLLILFWGFIWELGDSLKWVLFRI